jgi:hypothetical protein
MRPRHCLSGSAARGSRTRSCRALRPPGHAPGSPEERFHSFVESARARRLAVDCSCSSAILRPTWSSGGCAARRSAWGGPGQRMLARLAATGRLVAAHGRRTGIGIRAARLPLLLVAAHAAAATHLIQLGTPFVVQIKLVPEGANGAQRRHGGSRRTNRAPGVSGAGLRARCAAAALICSAAVGAAGDAPCALTAGVVPRCGPASTQRRAQRKRSGSATLMGGAIRNVAAKTAASG